MRKSNKEQCRGRQVYNKPLKNKIEWNRKQFKASSGAQRYSIMPTQPKALESTPSATKNTTVQRENFMKKRWRGPRDG